jgi:hypothetical protein
VSKPINTPKRRVIRAGKDGDESVPVAFGILAAQSAKDAFGILPQHLDRGMVPLSPKQCGHLHLTGSFVKSTAPGFISSAEIASF